MTDYERDMQALHASGVHLDWERHANGAHTVYALPADPANPLHAVGYGPEARYSWDREGNRR